METRSTIEVPLAFTIDFKAIELGEKLGQGAFGIVHRGAHKKTEVAVKQFLATDLTSEAIQEFINEVQIMAHAGHPNIIRIYGYCPSPRCIVMEYMPKGTLNNLLYNRRSEAFPWSRRLSIAYDIAAGLRRLHADNILHRDIKSDNVLLDRNYTAKLTDFGLSKIKSESRSKTKTGSIGTYPWMAPELDKPEGEYSKRSDIYSLGIVFWELSSRSKPPFHKYWDRVERIPGWVSSEGLKEAIPADCPPEFAELIEWCREVSPEKRPETEAVFINLEKMNNSFTAVEERSSPAPEEEYRTRTLNETSDYLTRTVISEQSIDRLSGSEKQVSSLGSQASGSVGGGFSEIEDLLTSAENNENMEEYDEASASFDGAMLKIKSMKHSKDIRVKELFGRVHGLYGEYCLRHKRVQDAEKYLRIARNFGYVSSSSQVSNQAEELKAALEKARVQAKTAVSQADEAKRLVDDTQRLVTEAQAKISKAKDHVKTAKVSELQEALGKTAGRLKELLAKVAKAKELSGSAESDLVQNAPEAGRLAQEALAQAKDCQTSVQLHVQAAEHLVKEATAEEQRQVGLKAEQAAQLKATVTQLKSEVESLLKQAQTLEQAKDYAKASQTFTNALGKLSQMKEPEGVQALKEIVDKTNRLKNEYESRRLEEAKAKQALDEKARIERLKAEIAAILKRAETLEGSKNYAEAGQCFKEALKQLEAVKEPVLVASAQELLLDVRRLSGAYEGRQAALAKPAPRPSAVQPQNLGQFLELVGAGEQDQVEQLLRQTPDLLLHEGRLRDLSGRIFEGITGLQYALWALDWHLWRMMLNYLPKELAAQQLSVVETAPWVPQFGVHAGVPGGPLDRLATALKTYVDNYDPWTSEQLAQHWQKEVGGAQRLLPAHAIHEYCRPDRSFVPCPEFLEVSLPRTRQTDIGDWFTGQYNGGVLGVQLAFLRYSVRGAEWAPRPPGDWGACDHAAVCSLTRVRVQQRDQLVSELLAEPNNTASRPLRR